MTSSMEYCCRVNSNWDEECDRCCPEVGWCSVVAASRTWPTRRSTCNTSSWQDRALQRGTSVEHRRSTVIRAGFWIYNPIQLQAIQNEFWARDINKNQPMQRRIPTVLEFFFYSPSDHLLASTFPGSGLNKRTLCCSMASSVDTL